jgi:hypothetical protein
MSSRRPVASTRSPRLWRRAAAIALVVLVALVLGGAIDPLQSGALTMLPALALAAMMLTRPYLGERAIARLRRDPARVPDVAAPAPAPLRRAATLARGGRLIAVALAGRAPPLAPASR